MGGCQWERYKCGGRTILERERGLNNLGARGITYLFCTGGSRKTQLSKDRGGENYNGPLVTVLVIWAPKNLHHTVWRQLAGTGLDMSDIVTRRKMEKKNKKRGKARNTGRGDQEETLVGRGGFTLPRGRKRKRAALHVKPEKLAMAKRSRGGGEGKKKGSVDAGRRPSADGGESSPRGNR